MQAKRQDTKGKMVTRPDGDLSPGQDTFQADRGRTCPKPHAAALEQSIPARCDRSSEANLGKTKVNNRFSELGRWILRNTGDGIERGDIVARFYGLEKLYCHFYVDPCFRPKERREYDCKYRYAQPRVTMTLKRLEKRGLVHLIRPGGKYVKRIRLTEEGKAVAEELDRLQIPMVTLNSWTRPAALAKCHLPCRLRANCGGLCTGFSRPATNVKQRHAVTLVAVAFSRSARWSSMRGDESEKQVNI